MEAAEETQTKTTWQKEDSSLGMVVSLLKEHKWSFM